MLKKPDHVSFVVTDVEAAKRFFALLGFEEAISAVASGEAFSRYMGISNGEADHITLVLKDSAPRFEVQLLKFHRPESRPDPDIRGLTRVGFNHICFAVDDLETEVARLTAEGVRLRNEIWAYQNRKIVFLDGPEGITLELAEWD